MAKKRKIQGRDWHGWIWKDTSGKAGWRGAYTFYAEANKPPPSRKITESGKWVRVKFVEVD